MDTWGIEPRGRSWWTLSRCLATGVAMFCALSLLGTPSASAGTYTVPECYPGYGSGADASYSESAGGFQHWASCGGAGLGMDLTGAAVANGDSGAWGLTAPAGTVFQSGNFSYRASSCCGAGSILGVYDANWANIGQWGDFGVTRAASSASFGPTAAKYLVAGIYCSAASFGGSYCFGDDRSYGGGTNQVYVGYLSLQLLDTVDPQLSLAGSITEGGVQHGTESLRVAASDVGGGPREARVWVNGSQVGDQYNGACAFVAATPTRLSPCPATSFDLNLNTQEAPWRDGVNSLQVCVYDVATGGDSPRQSCLTRSLTIDNSCPDSQGATGQATALQAGFQNQSGEIRPSMNVLSTQGATLRGSLVGPGGTVGGATVCIYEQIDAPAEIRQLVQVTKTRSDGSFTAFAPPGPSRIFDLAYRYNDASVEKQQVYLDSVVVPTLQVGPKGGVANGGSARFVGAIPGPHADGRAVTLQARAGKKWRTFKQLSTDRNGSSEVSTDSLRPKGAPPIGSGPW